jgi:hypothetical protein
LLSGFKNSSKGQLAAEVSKKIISYRKLTNFDLLLLFSPEKDMRFDSELCAAERVFLEERDKVVLRGISAFLHQRASGTSPSLQSPGIIL